MKRISVVIPTYKRISLLGRSLESIISNSPDEIIVVNDDPTETVNIEIERNIQFLQHSENLGLCAARNSN